MEKKEDDKKKEQQQKQKKQNIEDCKKVFDDAFDEFFKELKTPPIKECLIEVYQKLIIKIPFKLNLNRSKKASNSILIKAYKYLLFRILNSLFANLQTEVEHPEQIIKTYNQLICITFNRLCEDLKIMNPEYPKIDISNTILPSNLNIIFELCRERLQNKNDLNDFIFTLRDPNDNLYKQEILSALELLEKSLNLPFEKTLSFLK